MSRSIQCGLVQPSAGEGEEGGESKYTMWLSIALSWGRGGRG